MSTKKRSKRTRESAEAAAPVATAATVDSNAAKPAPLKWRWPFLLGSLIVLTVLVVFLSWVKLFDQVGVDSRLRDLLISNARTTTANVFDDGVWTILVDTKKQDENSEAPVGRAKPSHRKAHAQLLRKLAQAGVKVVVFDVEFETPSDEFDPDFAAAIQEAERGKTRVVLGGFHEGSATAPRVSHILKPAIGNHLGAVDGTILKRPSDARFIPMIWEKPNSEAGAEERRVWPSLSLLAFALFHYPNEEVSTWYHPLADEVRLRNRNGDLLQAVPVNNQQSILIELAEHDEMVTKTYEQLFDHFSTYAGDLNDAIVVIGYKEDDVLGIKGADGSPRYGAEAHANAVSSLQKQTYIRQLPFLYHFAAIVFLIAMGACLQIRCGSWMSHKLTIPIPITLPSPFDKIQIPTAIVVIFFIYGLIAIVAFKWGRLIFDMSYHLAALIFTYVLFVLFRSRLTVQ